MKRIYTALVIVILLASLCIMGTIVVSHKMNSYKKALSHLEELYDTNPEISYQTAKQCEGKFHKDEPYIAFFANHEKLDDLKKNLAKVRAYAKEQEFSLLLIECAETKTIIEDITEEQRILIHTIF